MRDTGVQLFGVRPEGVLLGELPCRLAELLPLSLARRRVHQPMLGARHGGDEQALFEQTQRHECLLGAEIIAREEAERDGRAKLLACRLAVELELGVVDQRARESVSFGSAVGRVLELCDRLVAAQHRPCKAVVQWMPARVLQVDARRLVQVRDDELDRA